jgi:hypothetical protein
MKKLVIVTVLILAFAFTANAQDAAGPQFGIKAGLNVSGHYGADTDEFHKMKAGGVFGFYMSYAASPQFTIQPEVLYSMKGWKWEEGTYMETGKTNYIEIPVLFKYNVQTEGTTSPSLFVGPAIAFLTKAEVDWDDDGDTGTEDIKDFLKSSDFSVVFGGGVDFAMGEGTVTFDARYTLGLSKLPDSELDELGVDVKNKTWSFMFGYGF